MIRKTKTPGRAKQARTGAGFSSADDALVHTTSPAAAKAASDAGGWQVVSLRGSASLTVLALCADAAEARAAAAALGGVAVYRAPRPVWNAPPPPRAADRDDF